MLPQDRILKAAKLEGQVGESRPGYLRDEDSGIIGPSYSTFSGAVTNNITSSGITGKTVKVALRHVRDDQTGERRTIRI